MGRVAVQKKSMIRARMVDELEICLSVWGTWAMLSRINSNAVARTVRVGAVSTETEGNWWKEMEGLDWETRWM